MKTNAAIYLVANKRSQLDFENLVYSIRLSGCQTPIILVPFDDNEITESIYLDEVLIMRPEDFPVEAHKFVSKLAEVLTDCPMGFLRRYYAYFGPFDNFLYSDNDVVALCDWSNMFLYLQDYDFVHADEEYKTAGRFNFNDNIPCIQGFGEAAMDSAITAGFFLSKKSTEHINSMLEALEWIAQNKTFCYAHDQTLLHLSSLIGRWNCLNVCKPPFNWLSSWSSDYSNSLELIQRIQSGSPISHLHYSGISTSHFEVPIHELLLSSSSPSSRLKKLIFAYLAEILFVTKFVSVAKRLYRIFTHKLSS